VFTIAAPEPKDAEAIAALLDELDHYYGGTAEEPRDARVRQISDALFGEVPAGYGLVVRDGATLAGFAAYSFLWPAAGTSRSLFLKELYVAESHRRRGIGTTIMQALFDVAAKHGCSRVEWHADDDNPDAMRFYAGLGFEPDSSKHFYRASGERLTRRLTS
jgi:GNAT superfamily N-acetyltransferase